MMTETREPLDLCCRPARVSDVDAMVEFNRLLALETEGRELDVDLMRAGVQGGLQRHPEAQYFVAECDGQPVAQLMLTREWSDWRNGWMLWLQSVYVAQSWRGQGVFRRLLDFAGSHVEVPGRSVGLRLYVERDNQAAMAAYDRLGFQDAAYNVMEIVPFG